jgi:hypothetical protein
MPLTADSRPNLSCLTDTEIRAEVFRRLDDQYNHRSRFEQFALFMGKAQLLEMVLKDLLERKYAVDSDALRRWTLGRVARELEQRGLRQGFIALLQSVVEHRNYIAHEFLADKAIESALHDRERSPLTDGPLHKGMYELEQIILIHDWCVTNDAWDRPTPTAAR